MKTIECRGNLKYPILLSLLLSALLFHEVSGSVLTVAWGLEGVALAALRAKGVI